MSHSDTIMRPKIFLTYKQPVHRFVLAGTISPGILHGAPEAVVVIGQGATFTLPAGITPLLEYFQSPRTENEAKSWLRRNGARADALGSMVSAGYIKMVAVSPPIAMTTQMPIIRK